MTLLRPTTEEELREGVFQHSRVAVRGQGTKGALVLRDATAVLDMTGYSDIVEYEPGEFVFTARAGTSLRQLRDVLAAEGQYLPFDPPLLDAGATIGGTVAAGLSGPGRLRFGGIRDFLIGVSLIDGQGILIRGGGKVVKNAAGFDLPKLMVGSLGRLGVLSELTFKVFPRPSHRVTLRLECQNLADAIRVMCQLAGGPWECEVIDLEPPGGLVLRLAGEQDAITSRAQRIIQSTDRRGQIIAEPEAYWSEVDWFGWAADGLLVKTPITPKRIEAFDRSLAAVGAKRRYSVAGNVAWIAWPADQSLDTLDQTLQTMELSGLALRGETERLRLGSDPARPFVDRIKRALDPDGRFGAL